MEEVKMLKDRSLITGFVRATVRGPDGEIKNFPIHPVLSKFPLFIQKTAEKYLGIPVSGRPMISEGHNIVTNEGDALIADRMSETDARGQVDGTTGHIEVGTGFVSEVKTALSCTTPTGSPEIMDATYPQLKGAWGAADDNVVQYRATFEAGDLNATGIDEAALLNAATATAADALAYAQISPSVNVSTSDTLQVDWELTFVGS
jgi:hypothetical protein